jgi:hypothetical protein
MKFQRMSANSNSVLVSHIRRPHDPQISRQKRWAGCSWKLILQSIWVLEYTARIFDFLDCRFVETAQHAEICSLSPWFWWNWQLSGVRKSFVTVCCATKPCPLRDLRLSECCWWRYGFSGTWCCVICRIPVVADFIEELPACIFRVWAVQQRTAYTLKMESVISPTPPTRNVYNDNICQSKRRCTRNTTVLHSVSDNAPCG